MKLFSFFKPKGESVKSTFLSSVSIRYRGAVHALSGMRVSGREFEIKIPFENKTGSDMLSDSVKRPDLKLDAVTVDQPFELVSVSPRLPLSVEYKRAVELTLKIKAPEMGYSGPLGINLLEGAAGAVRIELTKMSLVHGSRSVELEGSQSILNVPAEFVLKRDVQLYSVLEAGTRVNKVEASAPFGVSGTDPEAPFSVGKDVSILSLYIRLPGFNYTGPLEVRFS